VRLVWMTWVMAALLTASVGLPAAAAPGVVPPQLIQQHAPQYPRQALDQNLEGFVVVGFTVSETGQVVEPYIVESSNPVFNSAALAAIARYRYKPMLVNGVPQRAPGRRFGMTFAIGDGKQPEGAPTLTTPEPPREPASTACPAGMVAVAAPPEEKRVAPMFAGAETEYHPKRQTAVDALRTKVINILSEECRKDFQGTLDPYSVTYHTYEEGQTIGQPERYKLSASSLRGMCRVPSTGTQCVAQSDVPAACPPGTVARPAPPEEKRVAPMFAGAETEYHPKRQAAVDALRAMVLKILSEECGKIYRGTLDPDSVQYHTYEEGQTIGQPERYKLSASSLRGMCRVPSTATQCFAETEEPSVQVACPPGTIAKAVPSESQTIYPILTPKTDYHGNRENAVIALRSLVVKALTDECRKQRQGILDPDTVNYATEEEGQTIGQPLRYRLTAHGIYGTCRSGPTITECITPQAPPRPPQTAAAAAPKPAEQPASQPTGLTEADLIGKTFQWSGDVRGSEYFIELTFRENGQALRHFWLEENGRQGGASNPNLSHRAWAIVGGEVIVQLLGGTLDAPQYRDQRFRLKGNRLEIVSTILHNGTSLTKKAENDVDKVYVEKAPEGPAVFRDYYAGPYNKRDPMWWDTDAYWQQNVIPEPKKYAPFQKN